MNGLETKLKALADPARLKIVELLADPPDDQVVQDPQCGTAFGLCFCHLKEKNGLSGPTVSHHLKILREAGFVGGVRVGRWTYYRLRPGALEGVAQALWKLAKEGRTLLEKAV